MQTQHRSRVKILFWPGIACCFLVGFCSFCLYTGPVQASSITTSSLLITPTAIASPISKTPTPTVQPTPIVIIVTPRPTTQSNSQDYLASLLLPITLSLISGIFGAVLGGILTYRGSVDAAKQQIDYLYAHEKESREYTEKWQKEAMRTSLIVEIKENWDWLHDKSRKVYLSTEAWSTYKGNITVFSAPLQEELIKLYAEARRYNSVVEQVFEMYLNKMDNEPLFPLQERLERQLIEICKSVLKKLSEE